MGKIPPVSISIRGINQIYPLEFLIYDLYRPLWSLKDRFRKCFSIPFVLPVLYIVLWSRYPEKIAPVSSTIREINRITMLIQCDLWVDCEGAISKVIVPRWNVNIFPTFSSIPCSIISYMIVVASIEF